MLAVLLYLFGVNADLHFGHHCDVVLVELTVDFGLLELWNMAP